MTKNTTQILLAGLIRQITTYLPNNPANSGLFAGLNRQIVAYLPDISSTKRLTSIQELRTEDLGLRTEDCGLRTED